MGHSGTSSRKHASKSLGLHMPANQRLDVPTDRRVPTRRRRVVQRFEPLVGLVLVSH
jgi:hypothetical protein